MTQQATLPLAKGNNVVQFDSLTHRYFLTPQWAQYL